MYFAWEFLKELWESEYHEIKIVGESFKTVYFKDKYSVIPGVTTTRYVSADPNGSMHKQCIELMEYLLEFHQIESAYDTFRFYPAEDPDGVYFELFYQGLIMESWFVNNAVKFDGVRVKEYPNKLRCYKEIG